ncbi:uncharacterized protein LOC120781338 isoform X2 [Bactrocera tryoni]|uniref:uncharacterized protein LOC120781338 isoform X2 n=1 Tax=Bactrocera tryoni TaxID=59916 RepID=UPI001A95C1BD|nr:uncharacterized protein LOC120781338 isoform X2 [Bactrocera tryoni]
MSVPECKGRWRNIRAAYARSVDAYKTKRVPRQYYLAWEMAFLKPHLLKKVTQNNRQNNGINNSEAGANENDVHDMNSTHTDENLSNVMTLIDGMDEQSLRRLLRFIKCKLRQAVSVESNNNNELSAFMQPPLVVTIKEEPELSL